MATTNANAPVRRSAPLLALNGPPASFHRESAVRRERHIAQSPPTTANAVIHGDALNVLRSLPDHRRFDVIIADPPYNIGKNFGNNHDLMPLPAYVEWTQEWIAACFARLAPGGVLYVYGFPEILARVAAVYPIEEQRWLVWHYTNKTVPALKFWQRSHESILCLWGPGTSRPALEVDQIREPYTEPFLRSAAGKERKETASRFNANGRARRTIYNAHENGALPRDVIKVPALAGGAGRVERWFLCYTCGGGVFPPQSLEFHRGNGHEILKHPTQKPMELTKRLIRSRVNGKGGSVLAPFAGSGSECVVAQELGLEFLGIELNPEYVHFAEKWLDTNRRQACIA